jgi:prenyltransferase beta subunit
MKRWIAIPVLALVCASLTPAQAPTTAQKEATVAWIAACQKDSGGFADNKRPATPASLRATLSAVRALRYFGGELKHRDACAKLVIDCYDRKETGFAPMPGGKADALTTAVGLMAVKELDIKEEEYHVKPVIYLCANSKAFEEWRLAAAAYEAIGAKCELADNWVAAIQRAAKPDGTYGKGDGAARATAGAVVTLLRLGAPVDKRESVLKLLKAGQRDDGGWGKAGEPSDLETTYRVVRAFVMLKDSPRDAAACRAFIGRCRTAEGSYSLRPGQEGAMGSTYFAAIVLHWLDAGK